MSHTVEVDPGRLERWIEGFAARHDGVTRADVPGRVVLTGGDGARAVGETFEHQRIGLVLLRRGGHAVGRDEGGDLVAHTCGTGYVQSRTKAGGWSQQRYARRRGNQADGVVDARWEPDELITLIFGIVFSWTVAPGGDGHIGADAKTLAHRREIVREAVTRICRP